MFDFGAEITFDAIAAAFWQGSQRRYSFEIETSADGVNFTPAAKIVTSGITEDYEVHRLGEPRSARYIKFINRGNTVNVNSNLTELQLLKQKE